MKNKSIRNKLLILMFIVVALFIVACTNEVSNQNEINENDELNKTSDNNNLDNDDSNNEDASALFALLKNRNVRYTANYEVDSAGTKQQVTYVFDLPNFATIVKMDGIEARTIIKDSVAYSCTNYQGDWACYKLTDVNISSNEQVEVESYIEDGNAQINHVGKCSRAGLSGEKYEVTAESITSFVCYSSRGIILEMESENIMMYATEVSENINEEIFNLPADPQDFSNLFPRE